jgi:hypothetical protein
VQCAPHAAAGQCNRPRSSHRLELQHR